MRAPRSSDSFFAMDTAGARALARRIEEGRQQEEVTLAERLLGSGTSSHQDLTVPQLRSGVVYIRPRPVRAGDVRIFVRAPDGRLRRAS
jgi:hypothetical protein